MPSEFGWLLAPSAGATVATSQAVGLSAQLQLPDVRLFHTENGGDVEILNGRETMSEGLETAVYLSLFGGDETDDGSDGGKAQQWWGNIDELLPERQYRSVTQNLLRSLPAIPMNLRRIEDAANRDLQWMISTKLAKAVSVEASILRLNTVQIAIDVTIDDSEYAYIFTEFWRGKTQ